MDKEFGFRLFAAFAVFAILASFFVMLVPAPAEAFYDPDEGTISGSVLDAKKMTPLSSASVSGTAGFASGAYFSFSVKPGYYSISARASGHYGSTKSVNVFKGQRTSVTFYLTPDESQSQGKISGGVYNANTGSPVSSATIDGSLYMSAYGGFFSKSVDSGYYTLTAHASGYYSSTKSVMVYEGQTSSVSFYLTPSDSGGGGSGGTGSTGGTMVAAPTIRITQPQNGATVKGTLTISGSMSGVTSTSVIHVYLNGGYQGDIQGAAQWSIGPVDLAGWPDGEYTIGVQADNGQQSQMTTVRFVIGSGQQQQQQQQDTGGTDTGTPADQGSTGAVITGGVYISGTFTGIEGAKVTLGTSGSTTTDSVGSYTFSELDGGSYTITVSAEGYETMTARVTVGAGESLSKDFYMVPVAGNDTQGGNETAVVATSTIAGHIFEKDTNAPLQWVNVSVDGTNKTAVTDEYGTFVLTEVPVGNRTITADAAGYAPGSVYADVVELQTAVLEIYLTPMDAIMPVAALLVEPQEGALGQDISFNASGSIDPTGGTLMYMFDFGDGNSTNWTNNPTCTHQYAQEGLFYASLIVRSTSGLNSTNYVSVPVVIGSQSSVLIPVIYVIPPTTRQVEEEIAFDGLDSIAYGSSQIAEYLFDFGDDDSTGWTANATVTHTYMSEGKYTATLSVRDQYGTESTEPSSIDITIYKPNNPPTASFTVSKNKAAPGERVFVDASASSDPDNEALRYYFSYGDGKYSGWVDTPVLSHTYTKSGNYTVKLYVKDTSGLQSTNNAKRPVTIASTKVEASLSLPAGKSAFGGVVMANPGDVLLYRLSVKNAADLPDTIDVSAQNNSFASDVELLFADTMSPISDTNRNGFLDVGSLEVNQSKDIFVKVTVPQNASAGSKNSTTLVISGISRAAAISASDLGGIGNKSVNITLWTLTYPDLGLAASAVSFSPSEVKTGSRLQIEVNPTTTGRYIINGSASIVAVAYDGPAENGVEIGRSAPTQINSAGERVTINCTFDRSGRRNITVKVEALGDMIETNTSDNAVQKEINVYSIAVQPISVESNTALWGALIILLCVIIATNQKILFGAKAKDVIQARGGLTVYKKR